MNKVLHVTSVGKELLKDLGDKVLQELNRDKPITSMNTHSHDIPTQHISGNRLGF